MSEEKASCKSQYECSVVTDGSAEWMEIWMKEFMKTQAENGKKDETRVSFSDPQ